MNVPFRKYGHWTVVALLLFASASSATVASLTLTGVNPTYHSLNGVYTDPYQATINGVSTTVICDDWADDSYIGESWTANVINLASAGASIGTAAQVKWNAGSQTQSLYNEVAWLSTEMLDIGDATTQADLSFAIWELTCKATATVGSNCSTANLPNDGGAASWITAAANHSSGDYSNFLIYTPVVGSKITCGTGDCATTPPQEFIVRVSEPSVAAMLSGDLLGLLGLVFIFRRRTHLPTQ